MTRTFDAQQAAARVLRADRMASAVIPAGHQSRTLSPKGGGLMLRMAGSLPRRVCSRAWTKPLRSRWAVTTHQNRAVTVLGQGGLQRPAAAESVMTAHCAPSALTSTNTAALVR